MRRYIALLLAGSLMAAPTSALAQSAQDGYKPVGNVLGEVGTIPSQQAPASNVAPQQATVAPVASAPVSAPQPAQGSLPFTGLDLGIVAGLGVLLIVAGVGLRRLQSES